MTRQMRRWSTSAIYDSIYLYPISIEIKESSELTNQSDKLVESPKNLIRWSSGQFDDSIYVLPISIEIKEFDETPISNIETVSNKIKRLTGGRTRNSICVHPISIEIEGVYDEIDQPNEDIQPRKSIMKLDNFPFCTRNSSLQNLNSFPVSDLRNSILNIIERISSETDSESHNMKDISPFPYLSNRLRSRENSISYDSEQNIQSEIIANMSDTVSPPEIDNNSQSNCDNESSIVMRHCKTSCYLCHFRNRQHDSDEIPIYNCNKHIQNGSTPQDISSPTSNPLPRDKKQSNDNSNKLPTFIKAFVKILGPRRKNERKLKETIFYSHDN